MDLLSWWVRAAAYVDERRWQLRYQMRFRWPRVFWRVVAMGLCKFLSYDRALHLILPLSGCAGNEEFSPSRDWVCYRWIDKPFSERYWNLIGYLLTEDLDSGRDLSERLAEWQQLLADLESLYAFSKSPEPFDRHPIGHIQQDLDLCAFRMYKATAQIGFRLGADSLRLRTTSRVPLLDYIVRRSPWQVGSGALECIERLDEFRRGFLRVLQGPVPDNDYIDIQ